MIYNYNIIMVKHASIMKIPTLCSFNWLWRPIYMHMLSPKIINI